MRFEDILMLHNEYLKSALDKWFILNKNSKVGDIMKKMLDLIKELYQICINIEFEDYILSEKIKTSSFMSKVNTLEKSFDQFSFFLYKMIKSLADQGMFKELFLRIDFNSFYSNNEMMM